MKGARAWWFLGIAIWIPLIALVVLGEPTEHVPLFLLLFFLAGVPYAFAVWRVGRLSREEPAGFVAVLGFAVAFRVTMLLLPPADDIYRYVWEGKIQAYGQNPYALAPEAPQLETLRDADWERINHKDLTAIYPPLMEALLGFVARVSPSVFAMKLTFAILDLLCVALVVGLLSLRRMPASRALIYAWNPLVLFEIAGRGHNDVVLVLFFLYAVFLSMRGKKVLSPIALAFATMAKWISAPFVLYIWREWRWKGLAIFAAAACLPLVPFAPAREGLVRSLLHFGGELHFNDSVHGLVSAILPWSIASRAVVATAWLAVVLWVYRRGMDWLEAGLWIFGAFILLAPTVHPWYLVWVVPFLCFRPNIPWPWLLFTGTIGFYYITWIGYTETGVWREIWWMKLLEYGPPALLAIAQRLSPLGDRQSS